MPPTITKSYPLWSWSGPVNSLEKANLKKLMKATRSNVLCMMKALNMLINPGMIWDLL